MSTYEKVEQWCPHCLSQLTKVVATGFTFCPNIPECGYEVWEAAGLQPLDRVAMVLKSVAKIDKEIECTSSNLRALRARRKQLAAIQDYDWRQLLAAHLDDKVVGTIVCIPEGQIVSALDAHKHPSMTINFWLGSKDVVDRCGIWILLTDKNLDITEDDPVYAFIKLDERGLRSLNCVYTDMVIPC